MADFGLANFADSTIGSVSATECGAVCPERYFPEEFGIQDYIPTKASDIFAFGIVCFEVSGKRSSLYLEFEDSVIPHKGLQREVFIP